MIRDLWTTADLLALAFIAGLVIGLVAGFSIGASWVDRVHRVASADMVERAAEDRAHLTLTVVTCEQWRGRVAAYDEAALGPLTD